MRSRWLSMYLKAADKPKKQKPNIMFNKIKFIGRPGQNAEAKTAQNNCEFIEPGCPAVQKGHMRPYWSRPCLSDYRWAAKRKSRENRCKQDLHCSADNAEIRKGCLNDAGQGLSRRVPEPDGKIASSTSKQQKRKRLHGSDHHLPYSPSRPRGGG